MGAKIKIRLYDEKDRFCGEYQKVEEIFGCLRCKRTDGFYDLYSVDAEVKIISKATRIYWAPDGHMVAVFTDGSKNEIWQHDPEKEMLA